MSRPPRLFYALLAAALGVLAACLLVAAAALVWNRTHPHPFDGLFTPAGPLPPATGPARTNTADTTAARPTEAHSPATALPSVTGAPAAVCTALWQVTRPTPTVPCTLPDGSGYQAPRFACTDGRYLLVGDPNGTGILAGYSGDRLTAVDREQAVELAAQCQG